MDLAGKKIAVLGGTLISCEIVKAAHALGMHVTTIDYNPPEQSPAKRISDEHACISVADTGAVARYLAQQEIDGVITGYSDSILGFYADICDKANLPCYGTRAQFEMFTNKHSWKALCCAHGVPTAVEFDESLLATSEEEIPFPLMLKPVDGSGSRGVTIVRSKAELVEGWERSKICRKQGR